jgi:hypothetical protein
MKSLSIRNRAAANKITGINKRTNTREEKCASANRAKAGAVDQRMARMAADKTRFGNRERVDLGDRKQGTTRADR